MKTTTAMAENARLWKKFRETPGIISGTMDLQLMALPNHPNPSNWRTNYLRGTVTKITWTRDKRKYGRPSAVLLKNLMAYSPGKRSWNNRDLPDSTKMEYCGMGGGPIERGGNYFLYMSLGAPSIIIPRGSRVPVRHLLYKTRRQREEQEKQQEAVMKKLLKGLRKK